VQVADDAFLDKSGSKVSSMSPSIVNEYKEFDPMGRQILKTDLQDRSQQVRSEPASGIPTAIRLKRTHWLALPTPCKMANPAMSVASRATRYLHDGFSISLACLAASHRPTRGA
jgi:hypothetical protein